MATTAPGGSGVMVEVGGNQGPALSLRPTSDRHQENRAEASDLKDHHAWTSTTAWACPAEEVPGRQTDTVVKAES